MLFLDRDQQGGVSAKCITCWAMEVQPATLQLVACLVCRKQRGVSVKRVQARAASVTSHAAACSLPAPAHQQVDKHAETGTAYLCAGTRARCASDCRT